MKFFLSQWAWWRGHLPYIFVVALIVGPWFFQPGLLFFVDFVWGQQMPLGGGDNWLLFNVVLTFLSSIFSPEIIQKISIALVLYVVLLGGKSIAQQVLTSPSAVFAASLFSLFNPFVYERFVYGQVGVILGYGLFLLATGLAVSYLRTPSSATIIKIGILFGFAVQCLPHLFIISLPVIIMFCVLVIHKKQVNVSHAFLVVALLIVLNMHWLFGFFGGTTFIHEMISERIVAEDLVRFQSSGDSFFQVASRQLTLSGFWAADYGPYQTLRTLDGWGRAFVITIPLMVLGIIFGLRNPLYKRITIGLLCVTGVSFFFSLGVHTSVTKAVTTWLFEHISVYRGLRETQKWLIPIALSYTFFFSLGLQRVLMVSFFAKRERIISAVAAIVVIMQAPLLLFGLSGQVRATSYPNGWHTVDAYLVEQEYCDETGIFLPWHAYMSFDFVGRVVANPAERFFSCPVLVSQDPEFGGTYNRQEDSTRRDIYDWLESHGASDTDVQPAYILLAKDLDWEKYLWLDEYESYNIELDTKDIRLYSQIK